MIYHNWNILDLKEHEISSNFDWSLEQCSLETFQKVVNKIGVQPYWISLKSYSNVPETRDVILVYHADCSS